MGLACAVLQTDGPATFRRRFGILRFWRTGVLS